MITYLNNRPSHRVSASSYLNYNGSRSSYQQRKKFVKLLKLVSTIALVGVLLFLLFIVATFAIFTKDLPSPYKLTARDIALSTKIYDRNGEPLYDIYGNQNRALIKLSELPDYVKQATIAIEDKDFYKHKGFAPKGVLRALFEIVFRGRLQGGSTITQQVVKNTLLTPERTITRKIKEFILAIQVEKRYSKDEILQLYFNEVSYGGTAVGIEAAAEPYFNKKAKDLTLTEAVILAGLPQRPSAYSPFGSNPKAYIDRAQEVARRMREDHYIARETEDKVKSELPNVQFTVQGSGIKAPHFVLYVKDLLEEQYGTRVVEQGGLRVTTTLDLKLQEEAQKIVADEIAKLSKLRVGNGAAVVENPRTGEILAMVGSKDYFAKDYDGNVNVALAKRQPGSAIKPVNYASAFKQGYTASYMVSDVETEMPGSTGQPVYKPTNYDGKFHGPQQLRFALGNSYNIPAVKVLALGGIKNMLTVAEQLGLTTLAPTQENLERFGLSLTLGGGEVRLLDMVGAFGVFANAGVKQDQVAILKVTDANNNVLYEFKSSSGKRVLSEEIAFLITSILSDNNARSAAFGASSLLNISGKTVFVKTGTTDDKRDNWTVGGTPSVMAGIWVGNNDNSPMHPSLTSGVTGAAPIWNRVIRTALKNKPDEAFRQPGNLVTVSVDALDGGLPCRSNTTRQEIFIKGTEPTKNCLVSKTYSGQEYYVFREKDPVSTDGRNRWQEGIDAWVASQPDSKYHPPTEARFDDNPPPAVSDELKVYIKKPENNATVGKNIKLEVEVSSSKEIAVVELRVNGEVVDALSNSPYQFDYTFPSGTTDKQTIEVKAINKDGKSASHVIEVNVS